MTDQLELKAPPFQWRVSSWKKSAAAVVLGLGFGLAGIAATGGTATPASAAPPVQNNCFSQFATGNSPVVTCTMPTRLAPRERDELRRMSGDLFVDAHCLINVRIERQQIAAALIRPDHVFVAPPQPVTCEVITTQDRLPVAATFAPRIVLKGGRAVDATPGMADLTGLNEYIAWPVVQYINQSDAIRVEMIRMINMYIGGGEAGRQLLGNGNRS